MDAFLQDIYIKKKNIYTLYQLFRTAEHNQQNITDKNTKT